MRRRPSMFGGPEPHQLIERASSGLSPEVRCSGLEVMPLSFPFGGHINAPNLQLQDHGLIGTALGIGTAGVEFWHEMLRPQTLDKRKLSTNALSTNFRQPARNRQAAGIEVRQRIT